VNDMDVLDSHLLLTAASVSLERLDLRCGAILQLGPRIIPCRARACRSVQNAESLKR
jgi:hypothetical protein